jgi:Xaa-Pro aminopeptidase
MASERVRSELFLSLLPLCVLGAPLAVHAQGGLHPAQAQPLEAREYVLRTQSLLSHMSEGVAVLTNSPSQDVYYLTGVELPEARLILISESARQNAPVPANWKNTLYLPPRDPRGGVWDDPQPFPGRKAVRATGIENTADLASFPSDLARLGTISQSVWVSFGSGRGRPSPGSADLEFAGYVTRLLPGVEIKNLGPLLDEMRWSKTPRQIEIMRTAVDITVEAFQDAARMTRPDKYEYEIEAAVAYVFRARGSLRPAFMIIGSGPNSCVLHHMDNNRQMRDGDLLVIDIGTVYRSMATDLTRTIPVSGRFSEEQKQIYQIVLEAQKTAIAIVRPGVTLAEVHSAARAVIDAAGYGEYFIHGTSHTLNGGSPSRYGTAGTALSGVGGDEPVDRYSVNDRPLVPGSMFTIEPGIYIPERSLGVRIEDDILVTETGYEILTAGAPKEIEEIEALMRETPQLFRDAGN